MLQSITLRLLWYFWYMSYSSGFCWYLAVYGWHSLKFLANSHSRRKFLCDEQNVFVLLVKHDSTQAISCFKNKLIHFGDVMYNYAAAWTMDGESRVTGWGVSEIRRKVKGTSMWLATPRSHCRDITFTLLGLQDRLVPSALNVWQEGRGISRAEEQIRTQLQQQSTLLSSSASSLRLLNPQRNDTNWGHEWEREQGVTSEGLREGKKGGLCNYFNIKNLKRQWRHLRDTGLWESCSLIPRGSPLQGTVWSHGTWHRWVYGEGMQWSSPAFWDFS